jgi:phosphotransferase system enzyme I (PtsI)
MCGEMTGEPALALLLLGLGLDEFSMPFLVIPRIKQLIRSVSFKEAKRVAEKALELPTAREVEDFVFSRLSELAPEIYEEDRNSNNNKLH